MMSLVNMTSMYRRHAPRTHLGLALMCVAVISGCASDRTGFRLDPVFSGRDAAGVAWESNLAEFSRHIGPVAKREGSTFENNLRFDGSRFWLSMGVLNGGMRIAVGNKRETPLCLRLDKTTLQSNFTQAPVPLKVWHAFFTQANVERRADKPRFKRTELFSRGQISYVIEPYCIAPQSSTAFTLAIDSSALYPNSQLFNVRREGAKIIESGIGNTLIFNMPLEIGGKLEEFEMKLKAIDEHHHTYSQ